MGKLAIISSIIICFLLIAYLIVYTIVTKGLTYDFMRRFIRIMDRENLLTFEDTIKLYDDLGYSSSKKYQCVKEWFLKSYPLYKDMIEGSEPKIKKFKQNKTNEVAPAA